MNVVLLPPRRAVVVDPPMEYVAPSRSFLSKAERYVLSSAGKSTLGYRTASYSATAPRPPLPGSQAATTSATPGKPTPSSTGWPKPSAEVLASDLHYATSSVIDYPMKDNFYDLTVRRDYSRFYSPCKGTLCDHAGHKTPAIAAPPIRRDVTPSFRPATVIEPRLGDSARDEAAPPYCKAHHRFDCSFHAVAASRPVETLELPDFMTDAAGVTTPLRPIVQGVLAAQARERAFEMVPALARRSW